MFNLTEEKCPNCSRSLLNSITQLKQQFDQQIKNVELDNSNKISELNLKLHLANVTLNKRIDQLLQKIKDSYIKIENNLAGEDEDNSNTAIHTVEQIVVEPIFVAADCVKDEVKAAENKTIPNNTPELHDSSVDSFQNEAEHVEQTDATDTVEFNKFKRKKSIKVGKLKLDTSIKKKYKRKTDKIQTVAIPLGASADTITSKKKHKKYSEVFQRLEFCPTCNENLEKYSRFGIQKHLKMHIGDLKYLCTYCPKQFMSKGELTKHIRFHTGEKPYVCEICSKCFAQSHNMLKHQQRIHTNVKKVTCDVCQNQYVDKYDLLSHMRTHSQEKEFKCKICEKSFKHASSLRSHDLMHKGIKSFKCDLCFRAFSEPYRLKSHMQSHTGERPHECKICAKKYSKKCHLKNHLTSFHQITDSATLVDLLEHKVWIKKS